MKTTLFSLTTVLVFSYNFLFAANPSFTKEKNTSAKIEVLPGLLKEITLQLSPVTPFEATFEDTIMSGIFKISGDQILKMAPVTPEEASFEDEFSDNTHETYILSPLTPKEATFEDSIAK